MLILIGPNYSLVSIVNALQLLGPHYLLWLVVLYLLRLSVFWQIMLQLALYTICQIFLVGVPVLLFLVSIVVVPAFVPLVAVSGGIVGRLPIVVVHIKVIIVSVVAFYSFPPSFLSSNILLLLLLLLAVVGICMLFLLLCGASLLVHRFWFPLVFCRQFI